MTLSPKTIRVSIALLISLSFIAAGYFFSSPMTLSIANANSTEELLKAYAAKDTDGDGLPDWQESLYGTDITNPRSISPELSDKEAVEQGRITPKFQSEALPEEKVSVTDIPGEVPVSGSLTDRFAKQFFQEFMLSEYAGTAPTSEQVQEFVAGIIADLEVGKTVRDRFTMADVTTAGAGVSALTAYAVAMTAGMNPGGARLEKDELSYLNDALIHNDRDALEKITLIAQQYAAVAEGMRSVPAPAEAAYAHVEIMNSAVNLSSAIEDMSVLNEDPVRTLLGIGKYQTAATRFLEAVRAMYAVYTTAGVRLSPTDAGYPFFALLEQIAARPSQNEQP